MNVSADFVSGTHIKNLYREMNFFSSQGPHFRREVSVLVRMEDRPNWVKYYLCYLRENLSFRITFEAVWPLNGEFFLKLLYIW